MRLRRDSVILQALFDNKPDGDKREDILAAHVLFDAARVPNASHILDTFRVPYQCLFSGAAGTELADVAPYVTQTGDITPQAQDFLRQLVEDGHGLMLFTALSRDALRRHLKKFLRTRINGSIVHVKYYLPQNFEYILESSRFLDDFFSGVSSVVLLDAGFDRTFVRIAPAEV